jgi:HlyD family secretion protein
MLKNKRWITGVLLMIAIGVGAWLIWQRLNPQGLPEGFASGNGRIEGTEVDVSTKLAGRIAEILVNEGDFVTAGQVVARMDSAVLTRSWRRQRPSCAKPKMRRTRPH